MIRDFQKMLNKAFQLFGIDPKCALNTIRVMPYFMRSLLAYQKSARGTGFQFRLKHFHPILNDIYKPAGTTQNHYFFQDLWAAKKIFAVRPSRHIDIGSRIDGFVSHLLVFMPVEIIDIRPIKSKAEGLKFIQGNATNLEDFYADSIESISSLHAVEHFGLGRYGDQIDENAWRKAISEMVRILKPGGRIYFSVPIGAEHVEFNAHRIFSPYSILDAFCEVSLDSFAVIDDNNHFHERVDPDDYKSSMCACGLFEFIKP